MKAERKSLRRSHASRMRGLGMVALFGLGVTVLGGCSGDLSEALGQGKDSPDEFAILTKAPLVIPPDYSLRPPQPGAPRPQEVAPRASAEDIVFSSAGGSGGQFPSAGPGTFEVSADGTPPVTGAPTGRVSRAPLAQAPTVGESQLLARAGATNADPEIRRIVNSETRALEEKSETFADTVLFWKEDEPPATVIDADDEARRLRENQALGDPVTAGETPMIEPSGEAPLEGIFDNAF